MHLIACLLVQVCASVLLASSTWDRWKEGYMSGAGKGLIIGLVVGGIALVAKLCRSDKS